MNIVFMKKNSGLKKFKNLYKRYRYERLVLRAFFDWVIKHAEGETTILVCMDTVQGTFKKQGPSFVRVKEKISHAKTRATFSVYTPKWQEDLEEEENARAAERVSLFKSDFVCADEHVSPCRKRLLRHGLSVEEKRLALAIVRRNMSSFLATGTHVLSFDVGEGLPDIFQEPATVDVVIWVKGEMRGSIIFSAPSLVEALLEGSTRSARDGRFRPLYQSELSQTRFEINILSDLHIPLPDTSLFDILPTEKGYCARWQSKTGWYLPSVFNVTQFSGVTDFLARLATEKARIRKDDLKFVSFSFFEVETFIENAGGSKMQQMDGPLVKHCPAIQNKEDTKAMASDMADWICRVQDPSGYLPQYIDPYLRTPSRRADWPRMAFTAFALGVYGEEVRSTKYLEAGDRAAGFINSVLDDLRLPSVGERTLVHAYLGRLALVRRRKEEARIHADAAQRLLPEISFSPIVFLQAAFLFHESSGEKTTRAKDEAEEIACRALDEWERLLASSRAVSFAAFAELIPLLFALSQTGHPQAQEFSEHYQKVRAWYMSHQYRNGAFPDTTHSAFPYTRGTGKIFEALAVDKENLKPCLKSLRWMHKFRYSEDSLFCVAEAFRNNIRGSLMHDSLNHAAWIDSASHVLIGVTRLLHHSSPADIAAFFTTESM